MALRNRFEALRLEKPAEPNPPGSRSLKKKNRAAERAHGSEYSHAGADALPARPAQSNSSGGGSPGWQSANGQQGCSYHLALAADNLLVALEDGSGRQLACFTVSGPEQAAEEGFLAWVHGQVRQQQQQQQAGGLAQPPASGWQEGSGCGDARRSTAEWGMGEAADDDVEDLIALMLGGSYSKGDGAGSSMAGSGTVSSRSKGGGGAGGSGYWSASTTAPATPEAVPGLGAAAAAGVPRQSPAELWFDAVEEQQGQDGQGQGDDWQLAEALQAAEDAEAAEAAAAREAADAAAARAIAAGRPGAGAGEVAPAELADEELALQLQEEEDAKMAAALAEEERAAAGQAAAARSSSSFWSRLNAASSAAAAAAAGPGIASSSAAGSSMAGVGGSSSSSGNAAFPSLQAAMPGPAGGSSHANQSTRYALLRQHRATKQAALERGSGVRVLNRGSAQPQAGTSFASAAAEDSPVSLPAAWEFEGGLPPLQLEGGLRLHEDDLDYQLLLRDDGVTAAARAAAVSYADREEEAGAAGAAATSAEAMRAMIDAAARREAAAAGAGQSVPASGGGGSRQWSAASAGAAAPPPAGSSRPGSALYGGEGEAGEADWGPSVAPVDTKSLRRLTEDIRSRGWQLMGCAGGGHIRCERVFPDLPGFKQVYFLCSTPSDVKYLKNVAAAVKRFDREVEERRAQAAAASAAELEEAGGGGSIPVAVGRRPPNRQHR